MKAIYTFLIMATTLSLLFSCGKDEEEKDAQLVGTWNVTKVEGQQFINDTQGIYLVDNNPTGFITFESDGKGTQNYSFSLFGTTYPQNASFRWNSTSSTINIDRFNDTDLVWNREVREENKQVASYDIIVDANRTIKYTLTLEK